MLNLKTLPAFISLLRAMTAPISKNFTKSSSRMMVTLLAADAKERFLMLPLKSTIR